MDIKYTWIQAFLVLLHVVHEVVSVGFNKTVTKCVTDVHDETNPQTIQLRCDQNDLIRVKRAFWARTDVPLDEADNWCNFPSHNPEHCIAYEDDMTMEFIQSCNTYSNCRNFQYHTDVVPCHSTFNSQTVKRVYIHVEYECLPRFDQYQQIPFIHTCPSNLETGTGSKINIMTVDYPRMMPVQQQCLCILSMPMNTNGYIKLFDMGITSSQHTSCPVRVDIPGDFRCLEPGKQPYQDFYLSPAEYQGNLPYYDVHLTISPAAQVTSMSLWMQASAFDQNNYFVPGMRVTCYSQQRQDSNPEPIVPTTTTAASLTTSPSQNTSVASADPTSKSGDSTLYAAIGGSIAGILIIIVIIILVVYARKRRGTTSKKPENDLAYVCHANVSAAMRMGAEQNSYTDTRPGVSSIEPYAKSGGAWFGRSKDGASGDTQNLYSDIDDERGYNDDEQYSTIDIKTPQSKTAPFSYINNAMTSSTASISDLQNNDRVFVVNKVTDSGNAAAVHTYSAPMKSGKKPVPLPSGSTNNLYAQPDKAKKVKLTSQSSAYGETQMLENDVYNHI